MKKTSKFLIAGLIVTLTGAILMGVGALAGGINYVKKSNLNDIKYNSSFQSFEESDSALDSFSSIETDLTNAELYIENSENNSFSIYYKFNGDYEEKPLNYTVKNNRLYIKEKYKNQFLKNYIINIGTVPANKVVVYIPKDRELNNCDFSLDNGNLQLNNVNIKSSEFDLENGNFKAKDSVIEKCEIDLENGDFTSKNTSFKGKSEIDSENGDVHINLTDDNREKLSIEAESERGDVSTAKELKGKIGIDDDSEYERLVANSPDKLEISTENGDIIIK